MNNLDISIAEIKRIFTVFNEQLFNNELPEPIFTIQGSGKKSGRLGWFSLDEVWKSNGIGCHEINLTAEYLDRPVESIAETVLHEMIHLFNKVNDIVDVKGIHHNKKYRKSAEDHGLSVEYETSVGWAFTSLNDVGLKIVKEMNVSEDAFKFARKGEGEEKEKKERKHTNKFVCPSCGLAVRHKDMISLHCNDCDCDLELEQKDGEEGDN